jgi:quinol-cytochrome oxidoreductase complex cytochrome b subunit
VVRLKAATERASPSPTASPWYTVHDVVAVLGAVVVVAVLDVVVAAAAGTPASTTTASPATPARRRRVGVLNPSPSAGPTRGQSAPDWPRWRKIESTATATNNTAAVAMSVPAVLMFSRARPLVSVAITSPPRSGWIALP